MQGSRDRNIPALQDEPGLSPPSARDGVWLRRATRECVARRAGELAFCGKFEPPAVSFKEPSPDLLLKLPDLNAHCGLREIYEARGACEASGLRGGGERTQGGDVKKHAILVAKIWLASK